MLRIPLLQFSQESSGLYFEPSQLLLSATPFDIFSLWSDHLPSPPGLQSSATFPCQESNPGAEMYFSDSLLLDKEGRPYCAGRLKFANPENMHPWHHLRAGALVFEPWMLWTSLDSDGWNVQDVQTLKDRKRKWSCLSFQITNM